MTDLNEGQLRNALVTLDSVAEEVGPLQESVVRKTIEYVDDLLPDETNEEEDQ